MSNVQLPTYLADNEASHLISQAMPGAIVLQLRRDQEDESAAGQPVRRMFIELTMGEAVQHWRDIGDLIRKAGAMANPLHG